MKTILFISLVFFSSPSWAAMQETVWTPDTCDCQVVYEWDDSVPAEERVHTAKRIEKHDVTNPGLSAAQEYAAILENNQRKNKVYGQLLNVQGVSETVTQPDGTDAVRLKKGIIMNHSWTGEGESKVLKISVSGASLTNQQKTGLKNWADSTLGAGKVEIS